MYLIKKNLFDIKTNLLDSNILICLKEIFPFKLKNYFFPFTEFQSHFYFNFFIDKISTSLSHFIAI